MAVEALNDRTRLTLSALSDAMRRSLRDVLGAPFQRLRLRGPSAEQLLLVPQDLRTSDPSFATEIYHGHFGLAGRVAVTGTVSPFSVPPPSAAWARELHSFAWLRHLRAARDQISREQARALTADWLNANETPRGLAWEPEITARRVISWLSHSPILVDGVETGFYVAVLKSLTRQLRFLHQRYRDAPQGAARLSCHTALVFGGLCIADQEHLLKTHVPLFLKELGQQILPDGGHISRNPQALSDILLDVLPLRQCFGARNMAVPDALVQAIDRMMPMMRFFRLGDGSTARFNGMGPTEIDLVATLLAYDDLRGKPVTHAAGSGYCRLTDGKAVLITDVGGPPPAPVSGSAHAGCLSFEFSDERAPVVVNCGAPPRSVSDWSMIARTTAAHSTLTLDDTSSARLLENRLIASFVAGPAVLGPDTVGVTRAEGTGFSEITGVHDGYAERFGRVHSRRLKLSRDGRRLDGEDLILPVAQAGAGRQSAKRFDIRFHLAPGTEAESVDRSRGILLTLANGQSWRFAATGADIGVEESVYLADPHRPRPTLQIVLTGAVSQRNRIAWVFEKGQLGPRPASRREPEPTYEALVDEEDGEEEPLLLVQELVQPAQPRPDAVSERAPAEAAAPEPEPVAPPKSDRIDWGDADLATSEFRSEPSQAEASEDVLELTQETEIADDVLELTQEAEVVEEVLELTQETAAPIDAAGTPQSPLATGDDDADAEPLLLDQPAPKRKPRSLADRLAALGVEPRSEADTEPAKDDKARGKPKRSWFNWPRRPKRK